MKKILFYLCCPVLFFSCGDNSPSINMTYQQDFEIPAGLNTFDTHIFEINNIPTNKAAFFTGNGIDETDITEIAPIEGELRVSFGQEDLFFVREVVVEIFTRDNPTGKEIYFREQVPLNTGQSILLIPSLPKVTDILTEDQFSVRVELLFRDITPSFVEARLNMTFRVEYEL